MNEKQLIVRRLEAHASGRAVLTREASDISRDTSITLGIATIKIVTEEHVQAIAYGDFAAEPQLIARIDPLGRDASDIEPFAEWLIARLDAAERSNTLPRVWVPHLQTLETLDVLGHRYERNSSASASLQRMGQLCRLIAREYRHQGQQVVAVAAKLLTDHVATGQSRAEDAHLGSLLAWVNPPSTSTAADLARARSIEPASGVLANHPARPDDERVEALRRIWKRSLGTRRSNAEREIVEILCRAALDEWELLCEARASFWQLGLREGALSKCSEQSRDRFIYGLRNGVRVPRNLMPRIRELASLENSQNELASAQVIGDAVVRSGARRKGRGFVGNVISINQPRRGFKPCEVSIRSSQRELRIRRDDDIAVLGSNINGKVRSVAYDPDGGGSLVTIEVTNGVRSAQAELALGTETEWIGRNSFPFQLKMKWLRSVTAPWMLSEGAPGATGAITRTVGPDLLAIAERYLGGGA